MTKKLLCIVFTILFSITCYAQEDVKVEAKGAILMDFKTGRVLWEKDSTVPMPMASTTKIMTAVLALERSNVSDVVTVSRRAASAPEVNMNLKAGEKIYMRDLLYALMLQSSNDAAVAIAEHVGGSVEKFCDQMTEKAKELGAEDTVFVTPNGLDKDDHHSTAKDMANITRYALANSAFVKIINTSHATSPNSPKGFIQHEIYNKNRLLNEYDGALGVKTGFTGKAGQCFVGAAKQGDMQLISVVLASGWGDRGKEQKWIDTKRLLNFGFKNYSYLEVASKGSSVAALTVTRAREKSVPLVLNDSLVVALSNDEKKLVRQEINIPQTTAAPVIKGEIIGSAAIFIDKELVGEIPLVALASIDRHDFQTMLWKVVTKWTSLAN